MTIGGFRIGAILLAALLAPALSSPASACTVTSSVTGDLGTYSPPAVRASVVPALYTRAGLNCTPSVIVLLGINYIRAKFQSQNGMKLRDGSGNLISYTASADAAATVPFTQNGTVDYMQNNLLNILGLLGGSSAEFPIYVKPSSASLPPEGVYTDRITVTWNWYLCQGVNALFICLGTPDSGLNVPTTVDIRLTVTANRMVVTTSLATTWDPVNSTYRPKAIPGSRQRIVAGVSNPDIVTIDANTVLIAVAVPPRALVAFDGDKAGVADFVRFTDGAVQSKVTLAYTAPGSTTDDVEFSADGGNSWTYQPVAGSPASVAAITHIRLRPKGTMAASSNFSVSYPIEVK
jgi:hypothetical protein